MSYNKVPCPRQAAPCYTFDHTPGTQELRDNIVRCMHDMLSVEWMCSRDFDYYKNGACSGKHFIFEGNKLYQGLPYADANRTLFAFLEYYNKETGMLDEAEIMKDAPDEWKDNFGQALNAVLGNTCTGSTGWAYASSCASVHGGFVSYYLVPKNGFYPVGGYTFDFSVNNLFEDITTLKILADNGEEKMMDCYAQIKKADLVTMNGVDRSKGHSMMSLCDAFVKRDENGRIVPEESYILIQDQRSGFYDAVDATGSFAPTSGRLMWKASFRWLFDSGYMPVSSAELMGSTPWQKPSCSLKDGVLKSNYPMAVAKYIMNDETGAERCLARYAFGRSNVDDGSAFSFPLEEFKKKAFSGLCAEDAAKVKLKLILSNGAEFIF